MYSTGPRATLSHKMKTGISLLFVFLVSLAGASGPSAKEWNSRYQSIMKLMRNKDAKAFTALFADDFYLIDKDGKRTPRAQFVSGVGAMLSSAGQITANIVVNKVAANGSMVDVSFDFRLKVWHKKGGSTSIHEVGVDTWKKVGSKWLFAKTVDKSFEEKENK